MMESLAQLKRGESAIIRSIEGQESACMKLMDLGFTPGQEIRVLSTTIMNDPMAVSLRGTIIAIRRKEAICIKI